MNNMDKEATRQQKIKQKIKLIHDVLRQEAASDAEPRFHTQWVEASLFFCLDVIEELLDENESVWTMIDEIRASEIANYSEEFRQMMDMKLVEIKMLAATKPGLA
jgi:hypothetical protein